jgi:Na+/proline symporter
MLYLYYNENPGAISPAMKADGIFPLFAAQNLPVGLAGIVVAALMAATMSTLSSAINSVSNLGVEDYVRQWNPDLSDRSALLWGKGLTLFLGVFGTGVALLLARTNLTSIWDMAILILGILYSPMTAMFLLGVMTRRANAAGAWGGTILAVAVSVYCTFRFDLHPFFYGVISVSVCVVSGYLISLLFPAPRRDLTGLTVYSLPENNDAD